MPALPPPLESSDTKAEVGGADTNNSSIMDSRSWIEQRQLSCNGRWISFDDGHTPETLVASNGNNSKIDRLMALYPEYFEQRTPSLRVLDDTVPNSVVQGLYETTVKAAQPWGTYVSVSQLREHWKQRQQHPHDQEVAEEEVETATGEKPVQRDLSLKQHRDALALLAVDAFFLAASSESTSKATFCFTKQGDKAVLETEPPENKAPRFWSESDFNNIHGVAVWALGADVGSEVPYHLDYAEQVRYESNRIVPPVLAGTLQCTYEPIQGGTYCAHVGGLEHYRRHGYKGVKQQDKNRGTEQDEDALRVDSDPGWMRIPYRHNRLIVQSGHLPHLSTPITSIGETVSSSTTIAKRVIVGFNVFCPDIGPWVEKAPEHSQEFRRKVALQRWLFHKSNSSHKAVGGEASVSNSKGVGWNLATVRANPSLAKILVLAKRQKIKDDFARQRLALDQALATELRERNQGVLVGDLMQRLGRLDGQFPSRTDVQVHVHRKCQQGVFQVVVEEDALSGILSPDSIVRFSS